LSTIPLLTRDDGMLLIGPRAGLLSQEPGFSGSSVSPTVP
jgi:hypothetical protein